MPRQWDPHRRAYFPSVVWMSLLGGAVSTVVSGVLLALGDWGPLRAALLGVVIGYACVYARVWLWRRRHPWRPCIGCLLMDAATREKR